MSWNRTSQAFGGGKGIYHHLSVRLPKAIADKVSHDVWSTGLENERQDALPAANEVYEC